MMLLRGGVLRRLCSLSVRPLSAPADATAVVSTTSVHVEREPARDTKDFSDLMGHVSLREARKSRTRARVENQLRTFLKSRSGPANEPWTQGPPREAFWLLRACGGDMILETMATRMDLTQQMWKEFQKRGPLPVSLYNTLLQVYLQNGHRFDQATFLETMEEDGVLPNQGTLVGILCSYCEEGDIEGATRILDQMRSLDMEINENIYAALITGHCRRGDMESAEGMLTMMEENGMSPTATSYTTLLCGHADRGDMDRIESLLEEMRLRRVFPSMAVYGSIMDRLSTSGHSDMLPRALDLIQEKQLMYHDLYELVLKCTMRRDNKGTLTLLRCMATLTPKSTNMQLGAILIRTMAAQGRGVSEMMVMVAELQGLGFNLHHVYEEIVHYLHTREERRDEAMEQALTVLQDMHRHKVVVKQHYFYPILAYYAEERNVDGVVKCVSVMKDAGLRLTRMAFQYLLRAAIQEGVASGEEVGVASIEDGELEGVTSSDGISRLLYHIKGTPLSSSLCNEICVHLLDRGRLERVPDLISSADPDSLVLGQLLKSLKTGVNKSKSVDVGELVRVYTALHSLPEAQDLTRSISITTTILVEKSPEIAKQFLEELSQNGIEAGENAHTILLRSYATPDTVKEFHSMVRSMQERGVSLQPSVHKQMLELAADMGDPVRASQAVNAIKRSGQRLSATALSRYIIANAKSRRIGTALELYEKMRSYDLRPSYDAMNQLMMELLRWGDMHGAESMRKDLEEMGYYQGPSLRNAFIGAYARRDMTKALQEFESLKASKFKPVAFTYQEIMVGYSLHGDTESIRQLFDELQREGLSLDKMLVSRLFDAHVTKRDMAGALAVISEFPAHPPLTSSLIKAMKMTIDSGSEVERDEMEKVMRQLSGDAITTNAMFFAYAKAGHMERATQILQDETFVLLPVNFISSVLDMKTSRKVEQAYATLELLKGKGHHLRDDAGLTWLRVYDILGDTGAAAALKNELETAGHTLNEEFNSRLATMAQKHRCKRI